MQKDVYKESPVLNTNSDAVQNLHECRALIQSMVDGNVSGGKQPNKL